MASDQVIMARRCCSLYSPGYLTCFWWMPVLTCCQHQLKIQSMLFGVALFQGTRQPESRGKRFFFSCVMNYTQQFSSETWMWDLRMTAFSSSLSRSRSVMKSFPHFLFPENNSTFSGFTMALQKIMRSGGTKKILQEYMIQDLSSMRSSLATGNF